MRRAATWTWTPRTVGGAGRRGASRAPGSVRRPDLLGLPPSLLSQMARAQHLAQQRGQRPKRSRRESRWFKFCRTQAVRQLSPAPARQQLGGGHLLAPADVRRGCSNAWEARPPRAFGSNAGWRPCAHTMNDAGFQTHARCVFSGLRVSTVGRSSDHARFFYQGSWLQGETPRSIIVTVSVHH